MRTVTAGLLNTPPPADDECWSGAGAEFYKSMLALIRAWKQLGACGHPGLLRGALDGGGRRARVGRHREPRRFGGPGEVQFFRAITAVPLRGGWSKLLWGRRRS